MKYWLLLLLSILSVSIAASDDSTRRSTLGYCNVNSEACSHTTRSPIIIIPGLMGSKLEAKLNKHSRAHALRYPCSKNSQGRWFTQWINIKLLLPDYDRCFADNTKLIYDEDTKQYHNTEGVQIRVPEFGYFDAVEYLDNRHFVKYFNKFVDYFEDLGYTKGKDLNAAPYDWRYAPDGHTKNGYYQELYQLIEDSYTRNGNTPVTLVGHSMGGPVTTYFLSRYVQSAEWKASRIKQFISLSGAFGGSVHAIEALMAGVEPNFLELVIDHLVIRDAVRSWPSMIYMLPSPKLWSSNEVLVTLPNKTYTAHDYETLFADMKYEDGSRILCEVQDLTGDFPAPNVTHYCFYGTDFETTGSYEYSKHDKFPDDIPDESENSDNGDGTVSIRSLESCKFWIDKQEQPVHMRSFSRVEHRQIVHDKVVLKAIADIVLQD